MLQLQRHAGNAALGRLLARAPAVETEGHQEQSWARPSLAPASTPIHVATVHFRTKESSLDAQDLEVVKGLAEAYSTYARRNVAKPDEPQGVAGKIIGYADPRRSAGPDNKTLSEQRADHTARALQRAFVGAARMIDGHFHFDRVGAGVAPEAPAADAPMAEGNQLAPLRKAEILLAGQATEPSSPPPKVVDPPEDKWVKPPDLDEWNEEAWQEGDYGDGGRYDQWVERGLKRRDRGDGAADGRLDGDRGQHHRRGPVLRSDCGRVRRRGHAEGRREGAAVVEGPRARHPAERRPRAGRRWRSSSIRPACSSATTSRPRSGPRSTSRQGLDVQAPDRRGEEGQPAPDRSLIAAYVVPLEYLRFMLDRACKQRGHGRGQGGAEVALSAQAASRVSGSNVAGAGSAAAARAPA